MSQENVINISSSEEEDDDVEIIELRRETQDLLNHPLSSMKVVKKLNDVECPICFDEVTKATVTSCGHIFCLECILQSISSSSARGQTNRRGIGLCPLCRKRVSFKDTTVLRMKKGNVMPPVAKDHNENEDEKSDNEKLILNHDT